MSKLVHNKKLGYDVDITASLWYDALHMWWERAAVGEKVDLIIGVDGKPLIVPKDAVLYDGEWIVNIDSVLLGMDSIIYLELFMHKMVVDGDGIVDPRRSRANRVSWYMEYIDTNRRRTVIRVHIPCATDSKLHACERAVARHKYDVVHNAQYLVDNFGLPANGQVSGIVVL